ncbi:hypothetical protein ACH5RR_008901 [Cinchona calisaya]|uniref:Uncharacterized protein n=1 Tax=Cinchona calisaya TaxID=153742 RepID=A0ABD3AEF3_9GENT
MATSTTKKKQKWMEKPLSQQPLVTPKVLITENQILTANKDVVKTLAAVTMDSDLTTLQGIPPPVDNLQSFLASISSQKEDTSLLERPPNDNKEDLMISGMIKLNTDGSHLAIRDKQDVEEYFEMLVDG